MITQVWQSNDNGNGDDTDQRRDYSDKERQTMAMQGLALSDGSFPIKTVADLKNAVTAYPRSKNLPAAKAHIIKRARALKRVDLLPASWNIKRSAVVLLGDTEDLRDELEYLAIKAGIR